MKKIIYFLIFTVLLVLIITFSANYFYNQKGNIPADSMYGQIKNTLPSNPDNTTETKKEPTPQTSTSTTKPVLDTKVAYTLAEVKTHNSASSCWTIVRSDVYDLTSWIKQHPGGSGAILQMCGKDATVAFENQHGGQRRPENELAGYEIGFYKN